MKKFALDVPDFKVSVNITALQLRNDKFADDIFGILKRYDYPESALALELTERCKEMNVEFLSGRIAELRSRGIKIAFDDLGTGYSTVHLLMDIPVDIIKLDRDFVNDLDKNENYPIFVKALAIGSAYRKDKYTICFEGVETEEMLNTLKKFGPFLAQGYYFAKPLELAKFEEFVAER